MSRAIHLARIDTLRPVLVLTRAPVVSWRSWVTVAAITSTRRGLGSEVPVGPDNGLDRDSVINLDEVHILPTSALGEQIGELRNWQKPALAAAVSHAFDLSW